MTRKCRQYCHPAHVTTLFIHSFIPEFTGAAAKMNTFAEIADCMVCAQNAGINQKICFQANFYH